MKTNLIALLLISITSCHYVLLGPAPRGTNDDTMEEGPCGGFNSVVNRTNFPLKGGVVRVKVSHTEGRISYRLAFTETPAAKDFTLALTSDFTVTAVGKIDTAPLDLASLGDKAIPGAKATIQASIHQKYYSFLSTFPFLDNL
ncbi:hypothetical protein HDU92_000798 [Lobulomyces angularis]|nr:hypothetical protein HDU92_000798 [Lobulomyces angularis]